MRLYFSSWILLLAVAFQCQHPQPTPTVETRAERVKKAVQRDLTALHTVVKSRLLPLSQRTASGDSLRALFVECRLHYKRVEAFTEYYLPTTSRLLNGPPFAEIETEENKSFEPGGLQVIEELLYPDFDTSRRAELVHEVRKMNRELANCDALWPAFTLTDAHVFDALRLELFRLQTLGLSGFDTPLCHRAIPEAASGLRSLRGYLQPYLAPTPAARRLSTLLTRTEVYLRQHSDFDSFDQMAFLVGFANPLSTDLLAYQRGIGIAPFTELRALRGDAATLYDSAAFNPDYYAPDANSYRSASRIALGKRLFFDPILSGNGSRSCASCHQPERAFTDGQPKSVALATGQTVARNAPTLLNAALQNAQFYDLRGVNLESQTRDVIENRDEMHGSLDEAVVRLRHRADYARQFRAAYPGKGERLDARHLQNALASYERSLLRLDSPFDRYVRGERTALTSQEISGFNLFMGKAKCGICHFAPLFNGTVPPDFTRTESEVIGVPVRPNATRIDTDLGRYALNRFEQWKYSFKTPTVRNIARTAPYMHNGAFNTLEEVVEFYDLGGGRGLGFDLPNQTLPKERLDLTKNEKKALVAFLNALTDAK